MWAITLHWVPSNSGQNFPVDRQDVDIVLGSALTGPPRKHNKQPRMNDLMLWKSTQNHVWLQLIEGKIR